MYLLEYDNVELYNKFISFNSGTYENISSSDVEMFNYMKSLLVVEALFVVEGLALTNVNYKFTFNYQL